MKITICSSIDFTPQIIEIKSELEKKGYIVKIPHFTEKIMNNEYSYENYLKEKKNIGDIRIRKSSKIDLIKEHQDLIKSSDVILVLNLNKKGIDGYIGGNTLMEMGFAYGYGKKIFLYNSIPKKNERMHYVDEILAMNPLIINGDLNKIR